MYGPFADAKYLDKPSRIQIKFKARVSQLNFLSMQIGNFADVKCIPIQYTSLKCEDECKYESLVSTFIEMSDWLI